MSERSEQLELLREQLEIHIDGIKDAERRIESLESEIDADEAEVHRISRMIAALERDTEGDA